MNVTIYGSGLLSQSTPRGGARTNGTAKGLQFPRYLAPHVDRLRGEAWGCILNQVKSCFCESRIYMMHTEEVVSVDFDEVVPCDRL